MIVCICHQVSDKTIAAQARAGRSFDEIQFDLGVATQCGKCEDCARALVNKCHAEQSTHVECSLPDKTSHPVVLSTAILNSSVWSR